MEADLCPRGYRKLDEQNSGWKSQVLPVCWYANVRRRYFNMSSTTYIAGTKWDARSKTVGIAKRKKANNSIVLLSFVVKNRTFFVIVVNQCKT